MLEMGSLIKGLNNSVLIKFNVINKYISYNERFNTWKII